MPRAVALPCRQKVVPVHGLSPASGRSPKDACGCAGPMHGPAPAPAGRNAFRNARPAASVGPRLPAAGASPVPASQRLAAETPVRRSAGFDRRARLPDTGSITSENGGRAGCKGSRVRLRPCCSWRFPAACRPRSSVRAPAHWPAMPSPMSPAATALLVPCWGLRWARCPAGRRAFRGAAATELNPGGPRAARRPNEAAVARRHGGFLHAWAGRRVVVGREEGHRCSRRS